MKKLSLMTGLLLSSSMVYAGWVAHNYDAENGIYTSIPTSSCLEMICETGCVEDASNGEAHCCPEGTSTINTGNELTTHPLCKCPENQSWDTTTNACKMLEICPVGTTQYTNYLGEKSCCNETTHTLSEIAGTQNKSCCPNETPYWDGEKCVECLTDENCGNKTCSSDKTCVCRGGQQYTDETECACASAMVDAGFKNTQFQVKNNTVTWTDKTKGSIFLCLTSYWDGNIVLNNKKLNMPDCNLDGENAIIKVINGASLTANTVKAGFIEVENNSILKTSGEIQAKCLFTRGTIDSGSTIKATGCAYADGLWMSPDAIVKAKTSVSAISSRRNDTCSYYGILNWGGTIYSPSVTGKNTSVSSHSMYNEGRIVRSY